VEEEFRVEPLFVPSPGYEQCDARLSRAARLARLGRPWHTSTVRLSRPAASPPARTVPGAAFTNPFTDWSPDLRRLNLPVLLIAAALGWRRWVKPREATAQRPGLDAAPPVKILESEEDAPSVCNSSAWIVRVGPHAVLRRSCPLDVSLTTFAQPRLDTALTRPPGLHPTPASTDQVPSK
jgi:hypothetical protein